MIQPAFAVNLVLSLDGDSDYVEILGLSAKRIETDRALDCFEWAVELSERAVESDSFSIEYRRALGKIYLEFANTFATGVRKSPLDGGG